MTRHVHLSFISVYSVGALKNGGPVDYWLISTDDRDQTSINGAIRQRMKDETTVNSQRSLY
jgi:hypothetical protein